MDYKNIAISEEAHRKLKTEATRKGEKIKDFADKIINLFCENSKDELQGYLADLLALYPAEEVKGILAKAQKIRNEN